MLNAAVPVRLSGFVRAVFPLVPSHQHHPSTLHNIHPVFSLLTTCDISYFNNIVLVCSYPQRPL